MSSLSEDDSLEEEDSESEDDSKDEESESDDESEEEGSESESENEEEVPGKKEDTRGVATQSAAVSSSSDEGCERERCPVCLNRFIGQDLGIPENCEHVFCLECIREWAKNINTCPIDRNEFNFVHLKSEPDGKILKKIRIRVHPKEQEEEQVLLEESTVCEVCRHGDREDRLLLCDACDLAYHCDCLDPPLFHIPVEEWFCPPCSGVMQHMGTALPSAVRSRRVIPRTRASEAVRVRVQNRRTHPSASSSRTTTGVKRPKKRKRRTYRRCIRKVVKLARTKGAMGGGKGGKGERATAVMVTYRKRYKRRKRRKTKKSTKLPSKTAESNIKSAKERIAQRLGLVKARTGAAMPDTKSRPGPSRGGSSSDMSHSLFGTRDQLMDFSENFNDTQAGPSTSSSTNRNLPGPSAMSSDPLNLLDSILAGQKILHAKPDKVVIRTDGSLILKGEDKKTSQDKKSVSKTSTTSKSVVRVGLPKPDVSSKSNATAGSSLLHSALTKKTESLLRTQSKPGISSSDSSRTEITSVADDKSKIKQISPEGSSANNLRRTINMNSGTISKQRSIPVGEFYFPDNVPESSSKSSKKDKSVASESSSSKQKILTKKSHSNTKQTPDSKIKSDSLSKTKPKNMSDSLSKTKPKNMSDSLSKTKPNNKSDSLSKTKPKNMSDSLSKTKPKNKSDSVIGSKKSVKTFKKEANELTSAEVSSKAFCSRIISTSDLESTPASSYDIDETITNHRLDILEKRASFLKKFDTSHGSSSVKVDDRRNSASKNILFPESDKHSMKTSSEKESGTTFEGVSPATIDCIKDEVNNMPTKCEVSDENVQHFEIKKEPLVDRSSLDYDVWHFDTCSSERGSSNVKSESEIPFTTVKNTSQTKIKDELDSTDEEEESGSLIGGLDRHQFPSSYSDTEFEASESLIGQRIQGQSSLRALDTTMDSSEKGNSKPFIKKEPVSSDEDSNSHMGNNSKPMNPMPRIDSIAPVPDKNGSELNERQDLQTFELASTQKKVSFADLPCTQAASFEDLPCTQAAATFEDLPCTQAASFEDLLCTQAAATFEDLPCTQAAASFEDLPCTQAAGTFEDLPCTQAAASFEDLPCTQAAASFEDLPCTQAAASFEDLPCTQAAATFEDLPCTQAAASFEDLPTTQAVEPFEDLPCTQAVEKVYDDLPSTQAVESFGDLSDTSDEELFGDLPCTQAVESFVDLPCTQAVEPFGDLPCTQAVEPFGDLPCTQAVEPFEDLPCTQAVEPVGDLPCTQAVEPFGDLPCTQAVEPFGDLPCTQAEPFGDLPCTRAVGPFEDLPCTQAVEAFEDLPCTQAVEAFDDLPCTQAVEAFEDLPCTQAVEPFVDLPCTQAVESVSDLPCTQVVQSIDNLLCTQVAKAPEDLPCVQANDSFKGNSHSNPILNPKLAKGLSSLQRVSNEEFDEEPDLPVTQALEYNNSSSSSKQQETQNKTTELNPSTLTTEKHIGEDTRLLAAQLSDGKELDIQKVVSLLRSNSIAKEKKPPKVFGVHRNLPQVLTSVPVRRPLIPRPAHKTTFPFEQAKQHQNVEGSSERDLKDGLSHQEPDDKKMVKKELAPMLAKPHAAARNDFESLSNVVPNRNFEALPDMKPNRRTSKDIREAEPDLKSRSLSKEKSLLQAGNSKKKSTEDTQPNRHSSYLPNIASNTLLKTEIPNATNIKREPINPDQGMQINNYSLVKKVEQVVGESNMARALRIKMERNAEEVLQSSVPYQEKIQIQQDSDSARSLSIKQEMNLEAMRESSLHISQQEHNSVFIKVEKTDESVDTPLLDANWNTFDEVSLVAVNAQNIKKERKDKKLDKEYRSDCLALKKNKNSNSKEKDKHVPEESFVKKSKDAESRKSNAKERNSVSKSKLYDDDDSDRHDKHTAKKHEVKKENNSVRGNKDVEHAKHSTDKNSENKNRRDNERSKSTKENKHSKKQCDVKKEDRYMEENEDIEKIRDTEESDSSKNKEVKRNQDHRGRNSEKKNKDKSEYDSKVKIITKIYKLCENDNASREKSSEKRNKYDSKECYSSKKDEKDLGSRERTSNKSNKYDSKDGHSSKRDKHDEKDNGNKGRNSKSRNRCDSKDDNICIKVEQDCNGWEDNPERKNKGEKEKEKSNKKERNSNAKTASENKHNKVNISDRKNRDDTDRITDNKKNKHAEKVDGKEKDYSKKNSDKSHKEKDSHKHNEKGSSEKYFRKESTDSKIESLGGNKYKANKEKDKEVSAKNEVSRTSETKKDGPSAEKLKRSFEDEISHSHKQKVNKKRKTSEDEEKPPKIPSQRSFEDEISDIPKDYHKNKKRKTSEHSNVSSHSYISPDSTSGPDKTNVKLEDTSSRKQKSRDSCDERGSKRLKRESSFSEDTSCSFSDLSSGGGMGPVGLTAIKEETKNSVAELKGLVKVERSSRDLKEDIATVIKDILKPFFTVGVVDKDDYKDIMRKAVPKVFLNCGNCINPEKIKKLVLGYIAKLKNS